MTTLHFKKEALEDPEFREAVGLGKIKEIEDNKDPEFSKLLNKSRKNPFRHYIEGEDYNSMIIKNGHFTHKAAPNNLFAYYSKYKKGFKVIKMNMSTMLYLLRSLKDVLEVDKTYYLDRFLQEVKKYRILDFYILINLYEDKVINPKLGFTVKFDGDIGR